MEMNIFSVEDLPGFDARVAFTVDTRGVFREDGDLLPVPLPNGWAYMPWGADNQMPFTVMDMIEADETFSTCQLFNAEICYGSGLEYNTDNCTMEVCAAVERFRLENDFPALFLGHCQDIKTYGFAVAVGILNEQGDRIVRLSRKEACYCRFAPADETGRVPYLLYANWRDAGLRDVKDIEKLEILDYPELIEAMATESEGGPKAPRKFAMVVKVPTVDSTYYPIPYYASLFRGKWYSIKQLIAIAKEAKLKNAAPIKYHVELSGDYFKTLFELEHITDPQKQKQRMIQAKQEIIDFLTGAQNSGKALFSTSMKGPMGNDIQTVKITKIDDSKEGGDWASDIQEAINMMCFTLRVHSNLVGSVPGKAQSNNSGSDKRELYTIAQALQKPYREILFRIHRTVIAFNDWAGCKPECPFIQLTTLDQHTDAREVRS